MVPLNPNCPKESSNYVYLKGFLLLSEGVFWERNERKPLGLRRKASDQPKEESIHSKERDSKPCD